MIENDIVIFRQDIKNKILNDFMISFIRKNKDKKYKIEMIINNSVKLHKLDFWVTKDLLKKV